MDKLPNELSPDTMAEWIKAGPWAVALFLILMLIKRDAFAFLFSPRPAASSEHQQSLHSGSEMQRAIGEEIKRTNELLKEVIGIQRRILEEALRRD